MHACSGYFTSRPSLKRNIREHEGYLQAARVLDFLQGKISDSFFHLRPFDVAVSVWLITHIQAATVHLLKLCGDQLRCSSTMML